MKGYAISFFGLFCILMFTGSMFISDSLAMIWVSLELASLSLIPAYFLVVRSSGVIFSLFIYFIVTGVSSSMIVAGFLYEPLYVISFCGILVKLGFFPFMMWVYAAMVNSNWLVVWEYSTILKCVIFILPLLFSYQLASVIGIDYLVCGMFLFLSFLFWIITNCWVSCWCHMLLASTGLMVMVALCCSTFWVLILFLVYLIWCSHVIVLFSLCNSDSGERDLIWWFSYCFLLVSHPFSLSVFYKLVSAYCASSLSGFVVVCWLIYGLSEQLFLIMWAVNCKHPWKCSGLYGSL